MSDETTSSDASRARALAALNEAALAISRDLSLKNTLQQIVDSAGPLISARFAALGVFDGEGRMLEFVHSGLSQDEASQIEVCPQGLGLLKAILESREALRIRDVAQDPRSVGFPTGHPVMTTFLGLPIVAGEEVLGNLYLTDKADGLEFTDEDEDLMRIFANHAAVAIKNARLYEKVGQMAVGQERSRLGMDLHDSVIQSIYAVGLTLETASLRIKENPDEALALVEGAISGLNDSIRDIRNFILDLRPRSFEGNLGAGLARLVREFQANAMVEVELNVPMSLAEELPPTIARAIFFTTQEGLANVARHARASKLTLELLRKEDEVVLSISDDGRGFDISQLKQAVGHGLDNMRARAEELGGRFEIQSAPGQGTSLHLTLPASPREHA